MVESFLREQYLKDNNVFFDTKQLLENISVSRSSLFKQLDKLVREHLVERKNLSISAGKTKTVYKYRVFDLDLFELKQEVSDLTPLNGNISFTVGLMVLKELKSLNKNFGVKE